MMAKISVITCSHNPRMDYLVRVTNGLRNQTLNMQFWEYLLIDNASAEPLADKIDLSWHPRARHLKEEKLGLTFARLRGIQETTGHVLVFVDDDNVLDANYLETVLHIAADWPMLGAFGGQIRPEFEVDPPEWTREYWPRLAIREFNHDKWSNIPGLEDTMPNGAGLCVLRRVAAEYLSYHMNGKRNFVLDRTGTSLLSAGDLDLAATACDIGLGNGLFTSLKLTHLVPRQRVEENYLLRLMEAQTFSGVVLNSFRSGQENPKGLPWKTIAADQVRILFMNTQRRRFFKAARSGQRKGLAFLSNGLEGLDAKTTQLENTT
jgi:glycosyltransferase involved in cell wall biosynthesis